MDCAFEYGDVVTDTVTGFCGKVTGCCHYYGKRPDSYLVEGIDSTGRPIENWIDLTRLDLTRQERA